MRVFGAATAVVLFASGRTASAQRADPRCDSIIAASAVDTVEVGVFISVLRIDPGPGLTQAQEDQVATRMASAFHAPKPFRLSVFEGPASMRGLRRTGGDTIRVTRAPSVTGAYAVVVTPAGLTPGVVLRSSLIIGLDSAVLNSIATAANVWRSIERALGGFQQFQVRLSNDSTNGAHLLATGSFPRLPVRDAVALPSAAIAFPEEARADSLDHGEAVLQFVVDRDGSPALETVELVRASAMPFVRAALAALNNQRFSPATIGGCPVAQVVELPFTFDAGPPRSPRSDR